jgi:hypothetical protein
VQKDVKISETEQRICVVCGFCCDGTLFDKGTLLAGEKGTLPEKMEENYFKTADGEFFNMPCPYFNGKCSIYYQKKANICSSFRCRLLNDVAGQKVTTDDALKIISNVKKSREEIAFGAQSVLNTDETLSFMKLLEVLNVLSDQINEKDDNSMPVRILTAKCNILEALLARYFKPESEFNAMISEDL